MFNNQDMLNPKIICYTIDYLNYKRKLSRFLNFDIKIINTLYSELYHSTFFKEAKHKTGTKGNFFDLNMMNPMRAPLLYIICRLIKPEVVVETGVENGFSTIFILKALSENKKGRLFSIDLPSQQLKNRVGWLVPQDLRNRWSLILGTSAERLPVLLKELKNINLFYHDSDHSYANISFELNTAWDFMKPSGFLICDDINASSAFKEFSQEKKCENINIFKNGIARKN